MDVFELLAELDVYLGDLLNVCMLLEKGILFLANKAIVCRELLKLLLLILEELLVVFFDEILVLVDFFLQIVTADFHIVYFLLELCDHVLFVLNLVLKVALALIQNRVVAILLVHQILL